MPPFLAACVCVMFIIWLFALDANQRPGTSHALWIPILWACVIGSRPVSFWFGLNQDLGGVRGFAEDTLLDKGVFLLLIVAGLLVLSRRRVSWHSVFAQNKWVCIYFLYLGISVLWSGDPFVSCKRWTKDLGNVVMVLVVLSEEDQAEAVRALLARCAYLLIPLSVLVVKYYPTVSRQYDPWTFQPFIGGITSHKNLFGMTLFVCAVSLFWMLLAPSDETAGTKGWTAWFRYSVLMMMTVWLLVQSKSSTALSCTVLGCGILLGMKSPAVRSQVKRLWLYCAVAAVVAVLLYASGVADLLINMFVEAVGRDPSFHGRTIIWGMLLREDINPLIGVGFYSFWSDERMQRISEGYYYLLNEAHNGYIETYLNCGLIGVQLLVIMIVSTANKIKADVLDGTHFGGLRLAWFITILIYNITESTFDRLTLVWFALLLMMMEWPSPSQESIEMDELDAEETREPATDGQDRYRLADYSVLGGGHWWQTAFIQRWKWLPLWEKQAHLPP